MHCSTARNGVVWKRKNSHVVPTQDPCPDQSAPSPAFGGADWTACTEAVKQKGCFAQNALQAFSNSSSRNIWSGQIADPAPDNVNIYSCPRCGQLVEGRRLWRMALNQLVADVAIRCVARGITLVDLAGLEEVSGRHRFGPRGIRYRDRTSRNEWVPPRAHPAGEASVKGAALWRSSRPLTPLPLD